MLTGVAAVLFNDSYRRGEPCRCIALGLRIKSFGYGHWVPPGGKLEQGETPLQGTVREVAEEVSIILTEDDLTRTSWSHSPAALENKEFLMLYSSAYARTEDLVLKATNEFSKVLWVPLIEISQLIMWPYDRDAIFKAHELTPFKPFDSDKNL